MSLNRRQLCCLALCWVLVLTASITVYADSALFTAAHNRRRPLPTLKRSLESFRRSSFECVYEDGKSEHRVCIFYNIVLWDGQLIYIADGNEELPEIDINWLEPEQLQIQVLQRDHIPYAWTTAEVEIVPEALLGHQVNYANYYHVVIETLPTWHNIMCKFLGQCEYSQDSKLQLWLLEIRGPGAYMDLTFRIPALAPLYHCLSPLPPRHIKAPDNYGKVVVFEQALAGIGPDARAFHQWRPRFLKNWTTPPADMMHSWRHRLAQCLDNPFDTATVQQRPLRVTIVDRPYHVGRHILNVQELQSSIRGKWPGSEVQVVHIDGSDLKQQIALFQHTSILIWTHGAAMAGLLFLPQGAGAIELIPWPHADQAHEWAQSIQADFSLNIQVAWTRLTDPSHLSYHKQVLFKDPTWLGLTPIQRLAFLENATCPDRYLSPLNVLCRNEWMHYLISYVQPWEPLDIVLDAVYKFVQSHNPTIPFRQGRGCQK